MYRWWEPGPVNTEFVLSVQKAVEASPHASHPTSGDAYATMLNAYVAVTRQAFAAVDRRRTRWVV